MTTISIKVASALNSEVIIDSLVEVSEYRFEDMDANARTFAETWPDAMVTMSASNGDFVSLPALNEQKDGLLYNSGLITWEQYMAKWCPYMAN
jgi:hypothetical protein